MNSIQRAVFPAILISSLVLVGITRLIASPQITVIAATVPPVAAEPVQDEATDGAVEAAAEAQAQPGIEAVAGQPAGNADECSLPSSYPESIRQWCGWIQRYASEVELDPRLIAAVMLQESEVVEWNFHGM